MNSLAYKIRRILLQPATLTILSTIAIGGSFALFHRTPVITKAERDSDSIQIVNVRVVNDEGRPVAGASIRTEDGVSITDSLGTAQLRTSLSEHTIRLEATSPGYESSRALIEVPRRDANLTVILTRPKKPTAINNESYTETVRSGPRPSGVGRDFSAWYELSSPPPRQGYVIDAYEFALSGDRSCGAWAVCEVKTNTPTQVVYLFRMQGHEESSRVPSFLKVF